MTNTNTVKVDTDYSEDIAFFASLFMVPFALIISDLANDPRAAYLAFTPLMIIGILCWSNLFPETKMTNINTAKVDSADITFFACMFTTPFAYIITELTNDTRAFLLVFILPSLSLLIYWWSNLFSETEKSNQPKQPKQSTPTTQLTAQDNVKPLVFCLVDIDTLQSLTGGTGVKGNKIEINGEEFLIIKVCPSVPSNNLTKHPEYLQ